MLNPVDERFDAIRTVAGQWIASADAKITALLTVAAAVLAISLAGSPGDVAGSGRRCVAILFVLGNLLSIALASAALWPRTNRRKVLRQGAKPEEKVLSNSITAFTDIAKTNWAQFESIAQASDDERSADLKEQAFVLCRIASIKMRLLRAAIVALGVSLASLGALLVLVMLG